MSCGVLELDAQSPEHLLLHVRDGDGREVTTTRQHIAEALPPTFARVRRLRDLTFNLAAAAPPPSGPSAVVARGHSPLSRARSGATLPVGRTLGGGFK